MEEILKLAGYQFLSNELESIIKHFGEPVQRHATTKSHDIRDLPNEPFYKRSAFGQISQAILRDIDRENSRIRELVVNGKVKLKENEFADSGLVSYLVRHIFPYAPMLTRCIFTAHELPVQDDTNNTCESVMRTLKKDWFQGCDWSNRGLRPGRIAREHAKFIKGNRICP